MNIFQFLKLLCNPCNIQYHPILLFFMAIYIMNKFFLMYNIFVVVVVNWLGLEVNVTF